MKAYIQFANGSEIEMDVKEPDPKDGSFCAFTPGDLIIQLENPDVWIRIVPNES